MAGWSAQPIATIGSSFRQSDSPSVRARQTPAGPATMPPIATLATGRTPTMSRIPEAAPALSRDPARFWQPVSAPAPLHKGATTHAMPRLWPSRALDASARFWLGVAAIGLGVFAAYVATFYGGAALHGNPAAWNKVLGKGYVAGEPWGNLVLASHLLLAVVVTLGGLVQLVPQVRQRWPQWHRWNGRVYLLAAVLAAAGGSTLLWIRQAPGDTAQHFGILLNAVAILLCATMTWRRALARQFDAHRRWALRLFLLANGVWFFRVGLMLWLLIWRRPVGFDPDGFAGPFLTTLAFAQWLLPVAVLQVYFIAKERGGATLKLAVAGGISLLAVATGLGIFGATMGMWLPRM
jgi:hypothetical protein